MKRVHEETITNLTARFELPDGKFLGLYIAFDGVNQAAQTLTLAQCGQVQVLKNGRQINLFDFNIMHYVGNLEKGVAQTATAAGDVFRHSCFMPFSHWKDFDTGLEITEKDKWEVIHTFPAATGTIVASGTVFYGLVQAGEGAMQPYELAFINHHLSIAGAGTFTFPLKADNVSKIYIENDTNLTSLSIVKDGVTFVEQINRDDLYTVSQIVRRVETFSATIEYFDIDLNPSGDIVGNVSDEVTLIVTASGACVLNCLILSVLPTPDNLAKSIATREINIQKKVTQKRLKGLDKPARFLKYESVG